MAPLRIVGVALLVLGILSLAYQGITNTKSEKVLEVGPITATKERRRPFRCRQSWGASLSWAALSSSWPEPAASGGLLGQIPRSG